jgi:hypothetical protein
MTVYRATCRDDATGREWLVRVQSSGQVRIDERVPTPAGPATCNAP